MDRDDTSRQLESDAEEASLMDAASDVEKDSEEKIRLLSQPSETNQSAKEGSQKSLNKVVIK